VSWSLILAPDGAFDRVRPVAATRLVTSGETVDQLGEPHAFRMLPGFDDGLYPLVAALPGSV
jgi:hypothetical protein